MSLKEINVTVLENSIQLGTIGLLFGLLKIWSPYIIENIQWSMV